jgi:hypothetical protein
MQARGTAVTVTRPQRHPLVRARRGARKSGERGVVARAVLSVCGLQVWTRLAYGVLLGGHLRSGRLADAIGHA